MIWITTIQRVKGKVVYGQETHSGESTTTECWFNYQLLAVITEVAQWGAHSCSQPQPATDNGIRDGGSNWLVTLQMRAAKSKDLLHWVNRERATSECQTNALPVRPIRVYITSIHSWYRMYNILLYKILNKSTIK